MYKSQLFLNCLRTFYLVSGLKKNWEIWWIISPCAETKAKYMPKAVLSSHAVNADRKSELGKVILQTVLQMFSATASFKKNQQSLQLCICQNLFYLFPHTLLVITCHTILSQRQWGWTNFYWNMFIKTFFMMCLCCRAVLVSWIQIIWSAGDSCIGAGWPKHLDLHVAT